jgi:hypothetical protein
MPGGSGAAEWGEGGLLAWVQEEYVRARVGWNEAGRPVHARRSSSTFSLPSSS